MVDFEQQNKILSDYDGISKKYSFTSEFNSSVGWGCRIHQLHLIKEVWLPQWVSWYDTKHSDSKAPVMLEFWGMLSTPLLPSLPGPLWLREVVPERVLSMGQTELFDIKTVCKQMTYLIELLENELFYHLTVCKEKTNI